MEESMWGSVGAETVLSLVLPWLPGPELVAVGEVCAMWRRAVQRPWLWRAPLARRRAIEAAGPCSTDAEFAAIQQTTKMNWRHEYMRVVGKWRQSKRLAGAALSVAVCACGAGVAAALEGGVLRVWRGGDVAEAAGSGPGARRDAAVLWAADCRRLLMVRPQPLTDRWEVLIYELHNDMDDEWKLRVVSRATCGGSGGSGGGAAAAAAAWLGPDAFITLELSLLAPGLALTTLTVNAAHQRCWSESAGEAARLLRLYNEASQHFAAVAVAELEGERGECAEESLPHQYCRSMLSPHAEPHSQERWWLFVYACGGGEGRRCRRVACVRLPASAPPALRAHTPLRERAERHAAAAAAAAAAEPEEPPPPPTEQAVRALCQPPDDLCDLPGDVLGLTTFPLTPPHTCVWASVWLRSGAGGGLGAACVSLPTLRVLRVLVVPGSRTALVPLYYTQLAVSHKYVACGSACGERGVCVWTAASGVRCQPAPPRPAPPRRPPPGPAPPPWPPSPPSPAMPGLSSLHAVSVALHRGRLFVADDDILVWRNAADDSSSEEDDCDDSE